MPLVKKKNITDQFTFEINGIPLTNKYKYLGLTFEYNMNMTSTLTDKTKEIRTMRNNNVLKLTNIPLNIRYNAWKTYSQSKIIYPLLTLRLSSETLAKTLETSITMSLKRALSLNKQLSKEILFDWLKEPPCVNRKS